MLAMIFTALAVLAVLLMLLGPVLVLMLTSTFSNLVFGVNPDEAADASGIAVLVRNGNIAPESSAVMLRMGGPGVLDVDENSAVVLERFGHFTRAVGPGYYLLERFERVRGAVDLRAQLRKSGSKVYTRDGIPVQYDVEIEFRLLGETVADAPYKPKAPNRLWARIENPNAFGLTLSTLTGSLFLESGRSGDWPRAATLDLPLGLPLAARQQTEIPIDLSVSFSDLPELADIARHAISGSTVPYRLEGTIGVDAGSLGRPTFGPLTLLTGEMRIRR